MDSENMTYAIEANVSDLTTKELFVYDYSTTSDDNNPEKQDMSLF